MATVETVMASKSGPAISSAQAGQVTVQHSKYELTAAESGDNTLLIRMLKLPAGHRIVSLVVFNDDLDTGAAAALDIGIEDSEGATDDLTLFASAQAAQTAATTTRYENESVWEYAAADYDRYLVVGIETAAATGLAGGISAVLTTRPELGSQFDG